MRSYSVPVLKYIFTTLYLSFRCYLPWSNAIFPFLPLADDIDLMAARMKSCRLSYTASGMNISFDRSKTMVNSVGQETWEIQLNGMQLEEVQRFKCLGARLSKDGSCTMGCTFWLIRRERSRYLNTGYYLLQGNWIQTKSLAVWSPSWAVPHEPLLATVGSWFGSDMSLAMTHCPRQSFWDGWRKDVQETSRKSGGWVTWLIITK